MSDISNLIDIFFPRIHYVINTAFNKACKSLNGHFKQAPDWFLNCTAVLCTFRVTFTAGVIGSTCYFRLYLAMGFFNILFWKKRRGNVSPTMVEASVCTEGPSKCDVATNTGNVNTGGEINSHEAPPPAEYTEVCDSHTGHHQNGPNRMHITYNHRNTKNGTQSYSYGAPAPEYAEWCVTYAYSSPPAYPPEWS